MTARRDWYGMARVGSEDGVHAWNQNDDTWRVVKGYVVVATFTLETHRHRREDLSGRKAYRMYTEHDVTITVCAGYNKEYTLQPLRFYGGEVATIKQILKMFEEGHIFDAARIDAHSEARKLGATDLQLIQANDTYDWRRYEERTDWENKRLALRQYVELVEKLKKEQNQ